jgi:acetyl esterase/lipase
LRDATLLPYLYGDPTHPLPLPSTYNPISLLTPSFPPTFVLIASADKLLDPQQSRNFRDRLQELDVVLGSAEIPMEHGPADFAPDNDEMERMYWPWFEQGIGPGLDWVMQRLSE